MTQNTTSRPASDAEIASQAHLPAHQRYVTVEENADARAVVGRGKAIHRATVVRYLNVHGEAVARDVYVSCGARRYRGALVAANSATAVAETEEITCQRCIKAAEAEAAEQAVQAEVVEAEAEVVEAEAEVVEAEAEVVEAEAEVVEAEAEVVEAEAEVVEAEAEVVEAEAEVVEAEAEVEVGAPATIVRGGKEIPAVITRVDGESVTVREVAIVESTRRLDGMIETAEGATDWPVGEPLRFVLAGGRWTGRDGRLEIGRSRRRVDYAAAAA